MIFHAQRHAEDDPLTITPMVDVVFNLLAFFMLATQLLSAERDFGMGYQETTAVQGAAAEDLPSNVTVHLSKTPGGVGITIGGVQLAENDFQGLRARLTEINLPRTPVVLESDPSLSIEQVCRALDAVLASPMKEVSMSRMRIAEPAGGTLRKGGAS
ncbi:MAG: hypothetical protein AMXMBFR13_07560 [Phycisphaerae bacterium]